MNGHLDTLRRTLQDATAAIHRDYFLLPIADGDAVYRERTYCYELYHQLRRRWPADYPYTLGGEVDKGGHHRFKATPLRQAKPDLLVHIPGNMAGNFVVIEVKPITAKRHHVRRDFTKLHAFLSPPASYQRALYLVYGTHLKGIERFLGACHQIADELRVDLSPIDLYWHESPGSPAHLVAWNPEAVV